MSTINYREIEKFSKLSEEWWDPMGKFKPLHKFNPIRIKYIKENILNDFNINIKEIDMGEDVNNDWTSDSGEETYESINLCCTDPECVVRQSKAI